MRRLAGAGIPGCYGSWARFIARDFDAETAWIPAAILTMGDARRVSETVATIEPWFSYETDLGATAEAVQLELLLEAAVLAERLGCRRVWIEARPGPALPVDSLRLALAVAARTDSLRVVASGVRLAASLGAANASRSWIRLAEDVATVDGICGGRLEMAFAEVPEAGWATVSRLRDAWSGSPIDLGDGEAPVEIYPRPCTRDGPKLWTHVDSVAALDAAVAADISAIISDAEVEQACVERSVDALWLSEAAARATTHTQLFEAVRLSVPDAAERKSAWLASIGRLVG